MGEQAAARHQGSSSRLRCRRRFDAIGIAPGRQLHQYSFAKRNKLFGCHINVSLATRSVSRETRDTALQMVSRSSPRSELRRSLVAASTMGKDLLHRVAEDDLVATIRKME
jgi:hypothetical protein